jgi:hypothetical protein
MRGPERSSASPRLTSPAHDLDRAPRRRLARQRACLLGHPHWSERTIERRWSWGQVRLLAVLRSRSTRCGARTNPASTRPHRRRNIGPRPPNQLGMRHVQGRSSSPEGAHAPIFGQARGLMPVNPGATSAGPRLRASSATGATPSLDPGRRRGHGLRTGDDDPARDRPWETSPPAGGDRRLATIDALITIPSLG